MDKFTRNGILEKGKNRELFQKNRELFQTAP